jgi:hypothetical protein
MIQKGSTVFNWRILKVMSFEGAADEFKKKDAGSR